MYYIVQYTLHVAFCIAGVDAPPTVQGVENIWQRSVNGWLCIHTRVNAPPAGYMTNYPSVTITRTLFIFCLKS